MLYVFVNKEQNKVFKATYDENKAIDYIILKNAKLVARYFSDVEIWAVEE